MKVTRKVDRYGNIHYEKENGDLHREDGPARIWSDGDEWYYLNGLGYFKEDYEQEVLKIKLERLKNL